MTINYQIFANWDETQVTQLKQYGIKTTIGCHTVIISDVDIYHKLKPTFDRWNVIATKGVLYTKKEVLSAPFCVLRGWPIDGYPMPDDNGEYLNLSYALANYCNTCGFGKTQKDSIRIKYSSKYKLFGLQWIFDELFVTVDAYNNHIKKYGIGCTPVKLYKNDMITESIVQLNIPYAKFPINMNDYHYSVCSNCGSIKYSPKEREFFPMPKDPDMPIFKSRELFGDGCNAYSKIIIRADLIKELLDIKLIKYNWLIPCS